MLKYPQGLGDEGLSMLCSIKQLAHCANQRQYRWQRDNALAFNLTKADKDREIF